MHSSHPVVLHPVRFHPCLAHRVLRVFEVVKLPEANVWPRVFRELSQRRRVRVRFDVRLVGRLLWRRMTGMANGATGTTGLPVLLGCLGGGHRCCLLLLLVLLMLLVLLLLLGLLLLLLLLLRLLSLPFAFLLGQLAVTFLSFARQLRVRRRLKLEIRSTARVVVTAVATANEYRRLRSMALGVVRFGLGTRATVHVVHRRRWLRIRIDVQCFNVHRFVRMRMVTRWSMMARRRSMSWMVARMARGRSQHTDTTGCGVGMRSQGIHVAGFATDLQLILDEGIVRSGRIR